MVAFSQFTDIEELYEVIERKKLKFDDYTSKLKAYTLAKCENQMTEEFGLYLIDLLYEGLILEEVDYLPEEWFLDHLDKLKVSEDLELTYREMEALENHLDFYF